MPCFCNRFDIALGLCEHQETKGEMNMGSEWVKISTEIGDLEVNASAPNEMGIAHVNVRTPLTEDDRKDHIPVTVNGVQYVISLTFVAGDMVNGHPRCSYYYVRRPGWGKDSDKVTDAARGKIRDACEHAYKVFMASHGKEAFHTAAKEDLEYQIARLDEKISELTSERALLKMKLIDLSRSAETYCPICDEEHKFDPQCEKERRALEG